MIQHLIKLTCDNCGHSITYNPEDIEAIYGWTDDHCPKCKKLKGKKPRNLSPDELNRHIMRFAAGIPRRAI